MQFVVDNGKVYSYCLFCREGHVQTIEYFPRGEKCEICKGKGLIEETKTKALEYLELRMERLNDEIEELANLHQEIGELDGN